MELFFFFLLLLLLHVEPLLANGREISIYTVAVATQWFCKERPLLDNGCYRYETGERGSL
jgi:hypothetical protein